MNEIEYRQLCKVCDEILVEQHHRKIVISIAWLHVIREHPIFLKKYRPKKIISYIFELFFKLGIIFLELIKNISDQEYYCYIKQLNKKSVKILFISHLLNSNSVESQDFYFGRLPNQYDSLTLKINHTKKSYTANLENCFIFPKRLTFFYEVRFIIDVLNEAIRLFIISLFKEGLTSKAYRRAAFEVVSLDTISTLRIHVLVKNALDIMKPKIVVTTFEGHAWERMIFSSVNSIKDRDTISVGYQHAALFSMQHAVYRSLGSEYDPKVVVSAGEVGYKQMIHKSHLTSKLAGVLGSPRATNLVNLTQNSQKTKILVLPEGIIEDCVDLFSFSLECAKNYPNLEFIWRVHPLISFKELFFKYNSLKEYPNNILVSEDNYESDISRSKFALFRGSTAIISAVANGVIPLYFAIEKDFVVNPIYEIKSHLYSVSTSTELYNAVAYAEQDRVAIDYCRKFYQKLDSTIIDELLNS